MNHESIVVTGIGMATPLGVGRDVCWKKIKDGLYELSPYVSSAPFVNPNRQHRIFPLALAAVEEALLDAKAPLEELPAERIGCSVSVSKPILNFPSQPLAPETVNRFIRKSLELSGPSENVSAPCATGIHSILLASRWLEENLCDVAIAGSVESSMDPLYISGFKKMGVLSSISRPFDQRRSGFIMGEGAGILILERKSDAQSRGAKVYAEMLNCSVGSDTHNSFALDRSGSSISSVLKNAVMRAGIFTRDVDYINGHGTGTEQNDLAETKALKNVFGKGCYDIPVSSTKAATGHLLGASGSVEAAITCLAIQDQFVPPTLNLEIADSECDLDYVPLRGRNKKIETALSLSFGFGGAIGAIVFCKP